LSAIKVVREGSSSFAVCRPPRADWVTAERSEAAVKTS
jgi:hypothetical protein